MVLEPHKGEILTDQGWRGGLGGPEVGAGATEIVRGGGEAE